MVLKNDSVKVRFVFVCSNYLDTILNNFNNPQNVRNNYARFGWVLVAVVEVAG